MQELVLEATADKFILVPKYKDAVQRPTSAEQSSLDQKLIQRGQQEPIKVNRKMWVLDGYTRHELLEARGVPIKYEFRDFPNEEAEFEYVVETNIMRRQLNDFQRIETMHKFFITEKEEYAKKNFTLHYYVLQSVKEGATTSEEIVKKLGFHIRTVSVSLKQLTEEYCLSRDKIQRNVGGIKYKYKIMPKGEERLIKKPVKTGTLIKMIGSSIGVKQTNMMQGIFLIEHAKDELKEKLRSGTITMGQATTITRMERLGKNRNGEKRVDYWGKRAKIECPQCHHTAPKKDFIIK